MSHERRSFPGRFAPLALLVGLLAAPGCGNLADVSTVPYLQPIGPEGGRVERDGVVVEVPAGALQETRVFELAPAPEALSGSIGPAWRLTPDDVVLAVPAVVTLPYERPWVPSGVPEKTLVPGLVVADQWTPLARGQVDLATHVVAGKLDRTGTFGVIANRCYHEHVCPVAKVDVLWVIDDSTSMWQEQDLIGAHAARFVAEMNERPNLDLRVAVTTTWVVDNPEAGRFSRKAETQVSVAFLEAVPRVCTHATEGDDCNPATPPPLVATAPECEDLAAAHGGIWTCGGVSIGPLALNDNGSVNTYCQLRCQADEECQSAFGADRACSEVVPCSDDPRPFATCLPELDVDACPADLPAVLDNAHLELFPCLARVGTVGGPQHNLEMGLKAGLLGLQRTDDDLCADANPNVCDVRTPEVAARLATLDAEVEAAEDSERDALLTCRERLQACGPALTEDAPNFLRPDAWLVVIFLTDEDDCSDRDDNPLSLNDTKLCAFATDKLLPINGLVSSFRALKADAARVLVASIAGDALPTGQDSCLVPDSCLRHRDLEACRCYRDASAPACPALLATDQHRASCRADCLAAPDWEARRLQWCLDEPPTAWCDPFAEAPPSDNCFLLARLLARFDERLAADLPLLAADPATLTPDETACVARHETFVAERQALVDALAACEPALEEELTYRIPCVDACLGKGELNPARKCSTLTADACGCYDAEQAATPACVAAFEDELAYRVTCERACFRDAKNVSAVQPNAAPAVCQSLIGRADLGSRYLEFVQSFGANGVTANICDADRLGDLLVTLATTLRRRIDGE